MKVTGACHCGQIAFEADVDPASATVCHCSDCQVLSGSPYRVIVVAPAEGFVLHRGQPKIYVKTAASGNPRQQAFCASCGTPIYSAAVGSASAYFLRVGALHQRAAMLPQRQIWCDSMLPWTTSVTELEKRSGQ